MTVKRSIEDVECPNCEGTGKTDYVYISGRNAPPISRGKKPCWLCSGRGIIKHIIDIDEDWFDCIGGEDE